MHEIQNEIGYGAEYHTYCTTDSYLYSFVCMLADGESVCHVSFNNSADYAEMLGCDNVFDELESLSVGEVCHICGDMWLRVK